MGKVKEALLNGTLKANTLTAGVAVTPDFSDYNPYINWENQPIYEKLSDEEKKAFEIALQELPENMAIISMNYKEYVLSVDKANIILAAMYKLEEMYDYSPKKIKPISNSPIDIKIISREEYLIAKMHHLLLDDKEPEEPKK